MALSTGASDILDMFKSCPKCKGWGIAKDNIGFNPIKCPKCFGKCIVPIFEKEITHEEPSNDFDFGMSFIELCNGETDD
jgi:hypothetical protein